MDYNIDTPAENTADVAESTKNPEEIVNELVSKLKEGVDTKELEKDYDKALVIAAVAEKRRRDTQAAYTKERQERLAIEAEKQKLEELIAQELEKSLDLTPEQKEELEELKLVDPDEWRAKLNEIEKEQKTLKKNKLKELTAKAKEEALKQAELERRKQVLEEFQAKHPDVKIDDEVISNEVPPKYTRELEQGKISFEEFLEKVYKFLTSGKTVPSPKVEEKPDLTNLPGGATPNETSPEDLYTIYNKETF